MLRKKKKKKKRPSTTPPQGKQKNTNILSQAVAGDNLFGKQVMWRVV